MILSFRVLAEAGGGWRMRGKDEWSGSLCIHLDLEARAGQSHPMSAIRGLVNEAQAALYSPIGRPSIVVASA